MLLDYYRRRLSTQTQGHAVLEWSSIYAQTSRFAILADLVEPTQRVADVGCGFGDLLIYLRTERNFTGTYLGLDVVPEFIDECRRRYIDDGNARFQVFDALSDTFPPDIDCFLVSGMFSRRIISSMDYQQWMQDCVASMYRVCRQRVVFNLLTESGGNQDAGLFYADPLRTRDWCLGHLSKHVDLIEGYGPPRSTGLPADFTLVVHKRHT